MKRTFTVLMALAVAQGLFAQSISKQDICPAIFESYKTHVIRNKLALNPFPAGASVTWDFSQAVFGTDTFSRYDYMPASSTPYLADYPDADISMLGSVSYDNSFKAYWYYMDSAAALYDLGSNRGFITFVNSDAERLYQFPLNFQSPQSDKFCYESEAFGSGYNYCGRNLLQFDAYGTLMLPYGTYTNVKRLKYESWTANLDSPNDSSKHIKYTWYKAGLHKALLEYNLFIDTQGDTVKSALILSASNVNSINSVEQTAKISVYPNPANDRLRIASELKIDRIEIFSLQGQLVFESAMEAVNAQFDISGLQAGAYLLRLHSGTSLSQRKLIITD